MENKKLFKLAIVALSTVSAIPAGVQAVDLQENAGTLLAAGCGGGCGNKRSVSYNSGPQTDAYNYSTPSQSQGMNRSSSTYDTTADYNTNRGYTSSPSNYNVDSTYRSTDTYNTNRGYTSSTPSYSGSYTSDTTADYSMSGTMTEADLLRQLNAQGRAIYLSLDRDGRQLAVQLAGQDSYKDKNEAVREAQRRSANTSGMNNTTGGYNSAMPNRNTTSGRSGYNTNTTGGYTGR